MPIARTALALAGFLPLAIACDAQSATTDKPKHGGVLTFAVTNDPFTYDCHAADGYPVIHALAPHYSTLLRLDAAHYPEITGDLAQSWEVGDDDRTYVFHLYPHVRFHDGSVLTATDVKASFDRIRNPPPGLVSVRRAQFADVASIETPDDRTVAFRLDKPNAAMLTLLASPWNCIYSAKLMNESPDYPAKVVMGSGPFRFVQHVAGSKWVGRRFEDYFRPGLPYLDAFEAYVVSRPSLPNALEGRQVMAEFAGITPPEREGLARTMGDGISFEENFRLSNSQLTFNTQHKPFDDARVRRALAMAIDRWAMEPWLRHMTSSGLTGGLLRPTSPMSRTSQQLEHLLGFSRDTAGAKAEAKRLLKEAGQENLTFTLVNVANPNPYLPIGIYVLDQWKQLGLTVNQAVLTPSQWVSARSAGNFDVLVDFVGEFTDEPALWLAHYISHDRSAANLSRAIDRTLDELYEQQLRTTDLAERTKLVQQFEDRVVREAYVAPVSWSYRIVPLAAKVKGFIATPSLHANQDLSTVWLDQ